MSVRVCEAYHSHQRESSYTKAYKEASQGVASTGLLSTAQQAEVTLGRDVVEGSPDGILRPLLPASSDAPCHFDDAEAGQAHQRRDDSANGNECKAGAQLHTHRIVLTCAW
jgi:hypothetical protein